LGKDVAYVVYFGSYNLSVERGWSYSPNGLHDSYGRGVSDRWEEWFMRSLSIIIPVRLGDDPAITLHSLGRSEFQDFTITIQHDEWGNANKARNAGFRLAPDSEFVLFSDADIEWDPYALDIMHHCIKSNPEASYVYGSYRMGGKTYCTEPFNAATLRHRNIASTMSIIRRSDFPGWDESLDRLQDMALWNDMLNRGHIGVYCETFIFETAVRPDGITYGGKVSYAEAWNKVRAKYCIA
jgi:hypothetical protein